MNYKSTVYVIDSDSKNLGWIEASLSSHGYDVVAFDCPDAFLSLPKANAPTCVIVDLDPRNASALVQQRLTDDAEMPVIFISRIVDVPITVKAMRSGASDFLLKPVSEAQLLSSVGTALRQAYEEWADRQFLRRIRDNYNSLTRCEREVLPYIVRGFLNKQTAYELGKSEITIRIHRGQIMRKMNASSLADLVWLAGRIGIPDRRLIPENQQESFPPLSGQMQHIRARTSLSKPAPLDRGARIASAVTGCPQPPGPDRPLKSEFAFWRTRAI